MRRHTSLAILASCALLLIAFPVNSARGDDAGKPNFVFVLIDDMGWADLGCYGNTFNESPHIDRLARQGMRFTDAYAACPVCSPTRASIMAGKYPATLNLTDFIPGHWRPWAKLIVPEFNQQLPLEEVTVAETLKAAGYTTGGFGKWHLGGREYYPDRQGFDEWLVTGGRYFAPNFRTTPKLEIEPGAYRAEVLAERAEAFVRKNRDRPFFLYLSHHVVHIPLEARQELIAKYEAKPESTHMPAPHVNHPIYAAMVEHADRSVGRMMRLLEELKLSERTVFIFTSDNGGLRQRFDKAGGLVSNNAPLRDEKGSLYEGGIRVPTIVRWPGVVQPGSTCSEPVCSIDFHPTLAAIAGTELQHAMDGVSLVPLLKGQGELQRDALYWHYPHYHHTSPAGAVRAGDYKLIEYFEDNHVELYNLRDDLGESRDLAKAQPDRASELRSKLHDWRQKVGAKMPTANPDYDPKRQGEWKRRPR